MTQIKLRRDTSANFTSKNPILGVGEPAYETDTKKLKIGDGTTAYTQLEYFSAGGGGLEVCDIGMGLYVDETKGLRRYLNGQIVDINTNTQAFLTRLLQIQATNPDYFTTEDNWQAEALLNIDGCVYKFVLNYSGETVVSVRLPKYPDYVEINAGGTLPVVGNGKSFGLTNGTVSGSLLMGLSVSGSQYYAGMAGTFGEVGSNTPAITMAQDTAVGVTTDPTKSGIQTTLKQTKLKMRYFIQIATGSETGNNIINDIELNNPYSLFDSKYSDHELNNLSWLKSEGQWNSKAVYTDAYDKLLKVQNGTETVTGLSVKLSTETYTDYDFVLNTVEETFRLPLKTKLASGNAVVGNGMTLGLTNGTQLGGLQEENDNTIRVRMNAYGKPIGTSWQEGNMYDETLGVTTDPTKSGIETSDSGLYLYYYVGETVQNANLIDAGRIGEQLADKIGRQDCKAYITETYVNGTSGYRLYSDKWCEQWGYKTGGSNTVTLLKEYKDTNYGVLAYVNIKTTGEAYNFCWSGTKTVSTFTIGGNGGTLDDAWIIQTAGTIYWKTEGYIA